MEYGIRNIKNTMKMKYAGIVILIFLSGAFTMISKVACAQDRRTKSEIIQPVILVSDLMRPYDDPDDHWDLANAFALAYIGAIDLKGVVIDSPVNDAYVEKKNPDVAAVAMLNYLTGLNVPVVTGSPYPLQSIKDKQEYALVQDVGGVNLIHDVLTESEAKVKIIITGSSRDVAIALNRFPELFEEKCSGIYLNAGHGLENPYERSRTEWNTKLDFEAYHAIFSAPCPLFWLPCNVSHYRLKYGNVFPGLSVNMQKFFTFMYEKQPAESWFQFLQQPLNDSTINRLSEKYKSMFCTAGFFHAAGFFVDDNGKLISEKNNSLTVAEFRPVTIDQAKNGYVKYSSAEEKSNIVLLTLDEGKAIYERQMEKALKNVLKWLP